MFLGFYLFRSFYYYEKAKMFAKFEFEFERYQAIDGNGKRGIRTLGTRKGTTVFETVPIDHSGIFPMVYYFRGAKVEKRIE